MGGALGHDDDPGEVTISLVDVDELPVGWREAGAGDGDVVLFLHGLGASRTAWDAQLRALAARWRAIAWDCPGYGVSTPPSRWDLTTLADAAAQLLDRVGAARARIVGHSFGGMVALHLALAHPDRVDRLVLASTSPAFGLDGTDPGEWLRARRDALGDDVITTDQARAILDGVAGDHLDRDALDAAIDALTRVSASAVRGAMTCVTAHDVRDRLVEIASPTLVLVGELDHETPPAYAAALSAGIPDSRSQIIGRAGHLLPIDAPGAFNQAISEFFSEAPYQTSGAR